MTGPASRIIRAVAIPRVDPQGAGVHLAWSGPELLALADGGYEVRRRLHRRVETTRVCAVFDAARLAALAQVGVLYDELGVILLRDMAVPSVVSPVVDATPVDPASAGGGAVVEFAGHAVPMRDAGPGSRPAPPGPADLGGQTRSPPPEVGPVGGLSTHGGGRFVVFEQELTLPSDGVSVSCDATTAFAVPVSEGKAVGASVVPATGVAFDAPRIDTVVVYASGPRALTICADYPVDKDVEAAWAGADVLATGLTLPIHEADPALTTAADELQAARGRLLPSENLTVAEADRLTAGLRAAAAAADLGRPCDRVLLDRTETGVPFVETLFTTRLALLVLDPRLRRVLGFGFADRTAVPGQTYDYLVSGRFAAAELDDDVYDVHTVPSGTPLPTTFRIRGATFRLGAPSTVVLDPPPPDGALTAVSRRGIRIAPADPLDGFVSWWTPALSCVIDLPRPVTTVVLEVPSAHNLTCSGALSSGVVGTPPTAVPAGPKAAVTFPAAVDQLRLGGSGTLFALRLPGPSTGTATLDRACGPVRFAGQPLPEPPLAITATNLQTPPVITTGDIGEQTPLPARPQPGFRVRWVPSTVGALTGWPPDLAADPPVDALAFVIEHRRVHPGAGADPWEAIQPGDNLTFGSWPASTGAPALHYGADLDEVFPVHRERETGAGLELAVTDVLSEQATTGDPPRAAAPLGSYHQYRAGAVDIVGRVSATWAMSNTPRLEKHIPPPLPTGPQPPPEFEGSPPRLSGPPGVRARTILASDPDLSAADTALLAGHASAVLVSWGWRQAERDLDPTTAEFRVYAQRRVPTEVPCQVQSVGSAPGQWVLNTTTDRFLTADECAGQWISTGARTFRILSHTGGSAPQLTVAANALKPSEPPLAGTATFGRPLTPGHQRPGSWEARVGVVPLTADDTYQYVIFDLLTVDATTRRAAAWVGVTAADAEPYVDDELPAAVPNGGRPGNESSVAAVTATARYRGRPVFSMPPPLGDVPERVTDEPTGRQVVTTLDGSALLSGAVAAGASVALDRCAADEILAVASLNANQDVLMRRADRTHQTVVFPNSDDAAAVRAALSSSHPERLDSRYLLYLLGHFDRPDELFDRTGGHLQRAGTLTDTLPPKPGRYFYRLRLADASGAVSAGGAILPVVVRVPATAPVPTPVRLSASASPTALTVRVRVDPDPECRWVLLFTRVAAWDAPAPDPAAAQLVRMPNRRDLYPKHGIRLRLGDGTLLSPLVKAVDDADVSTDAGGRRTVPVTSGLPAGPPGRARQVQYWCYGLSRDGIPSRALGPFTLVAGAPP